MQTLIPNSFAQTQTHVRSNGSSAASTRGELNVFVSSLVSALCRHSSASAFVYIIRIDFSVFLRFSNATRRCAGGMYIWKLENSLTARAHCCQMDIHPYIFRSSTQQRWLFHTHTHTLFSASQSFHFQIRIFFNTISNWNERPNTHTKPLE